MTHEAILTQLKQGNQRFQEGNTREKIRKPSELAAGQKPHTIVLTCADSRVPPEMLFDQDLGDLFVVRIAGNTASDESIGSIEYAAANLGSSLCVVLGHSSCGAVAAAVDHVKTRAPLPSPALQHVVDPIVAPVMMAMKENHDNTLEKAIEINIDSTVARLLSSSAILRSLNEQGKLDFTGAKYDLKTGKVNFRE